MCSLLYSFYYEYIDNLYLRNFRLILITISKTYLLNKWFGE